ncbi:MAG: ParB N-terminal domain-containing protein [Alicyclobacillus macrosporangiidus]|nr:ParB N-terminal domain-containing protein [Alicyclobacillus macrosporangiidus]
MLVDIDKIVVEDRIRKDFGNLQELADDIRENGLINPPVVTPEFRLIAGERRLRACKLLGYRQIEVRVMTVKDYEHQLRLEISENENRKEFTFSERVEWARRLEQVEALKAKERMSLGGQGVENLPHLKTRDVVAEQAGFGSGRTYEKAKFIADHADAETIRQLDEGEISIHRAYEETKRKLAEAERRAAKAERERDEAIEQGKYLLERDKQLLAQIEELKRQKTPEPKVITKIVEPDDYQDLKEQVKRQSEQLAAHTREEVERANRYAVRDAIHDLARGVGSLLSKVQMRVGEHRDSMLSDRELFHTAKSCAQILRDAAKYLDSLVVAETVSRKEVVMDGDYIDIA